MQWKTVFMTFYLLMNVCQMHFSILFIPSDELIGRLIHCFVYFAFITKLIIFIYHGKTLVKLENSLKAPLFYRMSKGYTKFFEKDLLFVNRLTNCNRVSILLYTVYFCFYKIFFSGTKIEVPYKGVLPCNLEGGVCFTCIYLEQTFFIFVSVLVNTSLECLFSKLVTVCFCLFEIARKNLIDIDYRDSETAERYLRYNVVLHTEILR